MIRHVFIGYEPRQAEAFETARYSIRKSIGSRAIVRGLLLSDMVGLGFYTRPTCERLGRLIDLQSMTPDYNGEMTTEFAISRFLVPHLCREGWALFVDCDVMVRGDLNELFALCEASPDKALMCVKHDYVPFEHTKMDGRQQTDYFRKNWSSVMCFNCDHEAHDRLTLDLINAVPGRDLHRFCWLKDEDIGELPAAWNWLAQVSEHIPEPKLVHWTLGGPWLPAFYEAPFSTEWRILRNEWARGGSFNSVIPLVKGSPGPVLANNLAANVEEWEGPAWLTK